MKINFIQVNSREEINTRKWAGPDHRRADYVLKYRPDIIVFEYACDNDNPDTIFNRYDCKHKPLKMVRKLQKTLKEVSKEPGNGDAAADVPLWENIIKLWGEGHNVLLYYTDGPTELRREFFEVWKYMYPCAIKNWLWWVRIYLREKYMAKYIRWILDHNKNRKGLTVAIFLESFHWRHIKFLLNNPTKKQVWDYYFGKFPEINPKNIAQKIKTENLLFGRYWKKIAEF